MIASMVAVSALMVSSRTTGGNLSAVVYETDGGSGPGIAHVERIPAAPKALRGLIAMYAFQAGNDCDSRDASGLHCALTTAMGLGSQCSDEHVKIVGATFPNGPPIMYATVMGATGKETAMCYDFPDSASVQLNWTSIRMSIHGDTVRIAAEAARLDHADCSFVVHFDSVYRVHGETATQISNYMTPADWAGQCPSQ